MSWKDGIACISCDAIALELITELKKRKKLEPTSIVLLVASASSIAIDDVMPELPSAEGQSLWCMINTGRTPTRWAVR